MQLQTVEDFRTHRSVPIRRPQSIAIAIAGYAAVIAAYGRLRSSRAAYARPVREGCTGPATSLGVLPTAPEGMSPPALFLAVGLGVMAPVGVRNAVQERAVGPEGVRVAGQAPVDRCAG